MVSLEPQLLDHRKAVLAGHEFNAQVDRPNVVRVFLSSTFKDFVVERNHLFNHAFPVVDQWCKDRGLEFQKQKLSTKKNLQPVDLRWGIRDHVVLDHGGANLCIREVEHCQRMSVGTNFVAFVGDRYGHRPLPKSIKAADMSVLLENTDDTDDRTMIEEQYQIDANVVPPVYLLKHTGNNNSEGEDEIEKELRRAITGAAHRAHEKGVLPRIHPYVGSVTEQEIWQGILDVEQPNTQTFCFVRKFNNLKLNPDAVRATKVFADYVPPYEYGHIDPIAEKQLAEMKERALPAKFDKNSRNLWQHSINFDSEVGVNAELKEHKEYLERFTQHFIDRLITQTEDALKTAETSTITDAEYGEVARHAIFSLNKTKFFCGQNEETFDTIYELMRNTCGHAIVLTGPSGVGKTATVAKLVQGVWTNLLGVPNVVYRFLGTTASTSRIDQLIHSLVHQIAQIYGLQHTALSITDPSEGYNELLECFHEFIEQVGKKWQHVPPLVIVLDSLDQLAPTFGAYSMNWLPAKLPDHVKILVTVMLEAEEIWKNLRTKVPEEGIFELKQITNTSATKALVGLLSQQGRTLQHEQLQVVRKAFDVTQNPLFLHLVAVEATKWHSFTPSNHLRLGSTLIEAVNVLFDRLQLYHGPILVSRALGYLALAKTGLTEKEMEEVLSLDNDVLEEVYAHWLPPSSSEVTIPPLIWARLKQDMSDFIMNRQGDGQTVLGIYHKQFTDVIKQRYLGDNDVKLKMHTILAEFVSGHFADQPKPLMLKFYKGESRSVQRCVRAQPTQLAPGRYNRRKLTEWPIHLLAANLYQDYLTEILLNFHWWAAECHANSVDSLLDAFTAYQTATKDNETLLQVVTQTIRSVKRSVDCLPDEMDQAAHLAFYVIAQLNDAAVTNDHINSLVTGARVFLARSSGTTLQPINQCMPAPDTILQTCIELDNACKQTHDVMFNHKQQLTTVVMTVVMPLPKSNKCAVYQSNKLDVFDCTKLNWETVENSLKISSKKSSSEVVAPPVGNEHTKLEIAGPHYLINESNDSLVFIDSDSPAHLCFVDVSKTKKPKLLKMYDLPQTNVRLLSWGMISKRERCFVGIGNYCFAFSKPGKSSRDKDSKTDFTWTTTHNIGLCHAACHLSSDSLALVVNADNKLSLIVMSIDQDEFFSDVEQTHHFKADGIVPSVSRMHDKFGAVVAREQIISWVQLTKKEKKAASGTFALSSSVVDLALVELKSDRIYCLATTDNHCLCLLDFTGNNTLVIVTCVDSPVNIGNTVAEKRIVCYDAQEIKIYDGKKLIKSASNKDKRRNSSVSKLSEQGIEVPTVRLFHDFSSRTGDKVELSLENQDKFTAYTWQKGTLGCTQVAEQRLRTFESDKVTSVRTVFVAIDDGVLLYADKTGDIRIWNATTKESILVTSTGSPVSKCHYCAQQRVCVVLLENQMLFAIDMATRQSERVQVNKVVWTLDDWRLTDLAVNTHGLLLLTKKHAVVQTLKNTKIRHEFDWTKSEGLAAWTIDPDRFAYCLLSPQNQSLNQLSVQIVSMQSFNQLNQLTLPKINQSITDQKLDAKLALIGAQYIAATITNNQQSLLFLADLSQNSDVNATWQMQLELPGACVCLKAENGLLGWATKNGYFAAQRLHAARPPTAVIEEQEKERMSKNRNRTKTCVIL